MPIPLLGILKDGQDAHPTFRDFGCFFIWKSLSFLKGDLSFQVGTYYPGAYLLY
jgi:hypothetical protein